MNKLIKKYAESFKRYGFVNTIRHILAKIGININIHDDIWKKRIYLSKKINEICQGTIIDGIYKGTKLIYSSDYYLSKPAYLLGCYEKEVQQAIYNFSNKENLKYFINIGAGEGYHSVGVKNANLFENSIAFELDKKDRETIKQNFNLNNIFDGFKIYEKANIDFLKILEKKIELSKSLFLFDIEGDEFNILNETNLNILRNSFLIIEIHHFYSTPNIVDNFEKTLKKFYIVNEIITGNRNFSDFKILNRFNDDEKWLMMSESRSSTMKWLICEPLSS